MKKTFQSAELAHEKNESLSKLIKHGFLYFCSLVIAILPVIRFSLLEPVFIIFLSHLVIDWAKARFINTTAGQPASKILFLALGLTCNSKASQYHSKKKC